MGLIDSIKSLLGSSTGSEGDAAASAPGLVGTSLDSSEAIAGSEAKPGPTSVVADTPAVSGQDMAQGAAEVASSPSANVTPADTAQPEQGAYGYGTMTGDGSASIQDSIDNLQDNTPQ